MKQISASYYLLILILPGLCSFMLSCNETNQLNLPADYKFVTEIDTTAIDFDPSTLSYIPSQSRMQLIHDNYPPHEITLNYEQLFREFEIMEADQYLINQAKSADIFILNEAHHFPTHRRFARSLLKGLWDANYRYFGLEALTYTKNFEQPPYPTYSLGYYFKEPTFALLIREAIDLGFTLFPYEYNGPESGKIREQTQAENIAQFLNDHKEGKTFIYCGYSHNFKCELPEWGKAMAGWLAEMVDDSILSVNQFYFNDIAELNAEKPCVLVDSNQQPYRYDYCTDLFVFHPVYNYSQSRCNWKADAKTQWKKIDFIPPKVEYPILVLSYYNHEEIENGIPFDCIELTNPTQIEWLLLPQNDSYEIRAIDRSHNLIPLAL